jgi:hypothetical protein
MGMAVYKDQSSFDQEYALLNWLDDFPEELQEQIKEELEEIAQEILQAAIDYCPKDTGALASSISLDDSAGAIQAGDFYGFNLSAGSPDIINPKTGKSTDTYALFVEDGHFMPNGDFYEGVPFLEMAIEQYEAELDAIMDRALSELGANSQ